MRTTKSLESALLVKRILFLACFLCFVGSAPTLFWAQSNIVAARLEGVVTDQAGAAIPGASLSLSSMQTGVERKFTTSNEGQYVFNLLPPGTYRLRVEKPGFKTYEQPNIALTVAQASTINVTLGVGAVTETVEATATGPILQTEDANIGTDTTAHTIVEMPLNLRNVVALVELNSAVNSNSIYQAGNPGGTPGAFDDQDIAFFNFGGGRFGTTAFLLDGHWNASAYGGNLLMYAPGVDETEEFKIQTNAFTTQYGWSMGNYASIITKAGTSSFHGDVFEFLRNSDMDANYYFNNRNGIKRPIFRMNQFGFTAGGPFWIPKVYQQRNKTYIFGSFQGRRQSTPASVDTDVPTSAMQAGDFSTFLGSQIGTDALGRTVYQGELYNPFTTRSLNNGQVDRTTGLTAHCPGSPAPASCFIRDPFSGNIIPSGLLDSVALAAQKFYPHPNASGIFNYFATGSAPSSEDAYTVRVDHNISEKSRIYSRWSQKHESSTLNGSPNYFGAGSPAGNYVFSPDNRWDFALDYSHSFSPTTLMSVDLGYGRWDQARTPPVLYRAAELGLPSFLDGAGFPASQSVFPTFNISGEQTLGPVTGFNGTPEDNKIVAVDFSKVHGKHSLAFGYMLVDFTWKNFSNYPATFNFTPNFTEGPDPTAANPNTGLGYASFLLGTGSGSIQQGARAWDHKDWHGLYIQDDWKVIPKLTLNLGLRYEYQTAPADHFDRFAWFNFQGANPISHQVGLNVPGYLQFTGNGFRKGIYVPQKDNFAPRVGLAYSVTNKLVARAGFGMFYTPALEMADYEGLDEFGASQITPWVGTLDGITPLNLLNNPMPSGLIQPPGRSLGALTNVGQSTDAINSVRPTPYVEQWTLGFQYALGQNDSLEVAYIGNHGVKLLASGVQVDQLYPGYLKLGNNLLNQVPNPFYGHITSSACGLNNPTVAEGQLLRPYPEFCGVNDAQAPVQSSYYDAFEITYTHRWSQGLHVLASFTASKYLDNGDGNEGWAVPGGSTIQNNYNLAAEKALDGDDIPKSLVLSYIYELPVGKGKALGNSWARPLDAVLGGWQFTGITTFKSGFPLAVTNVVDNSGDLGGGGQRPNLVGDPNLAHRTINEWFNTAAFAQPAPYTFGNVSRTLPNTRAPGLNNWDLGVQKWFNLNERIRFQLRGEAFNAFNHANFYAPNTSFGSPLFGTINAAYPARDVQVALKLYW